MYLSELYDKQNWANLYIFSVWNYLSLLCKNFLLFILYSRWQERESNYHLSQLYNKTYVLLYTINIDPTVLSQYRIWDLLNYWVWKKQAYKSHWKVCLFQSAKLPIGKRVKIHLLLVKLSSHLVFWRVPLFTAACKVYLLLVKSYVSLNPEVNRSWHRLYMAEVQI